MTTVAVSAPNRQSVWRRSQNARTAYLFLFRALIVMAIITFYPLVFQIWMSFTNYGLANLRATAPAPDYVGLENYGRILDNNIVIPNFDFLRILIFNLFWAFSNVVIHVVLGVIVALILNTKGLLGKRLYRAIFILPVVIPQIIVATVSRDMFEPNHCAINFLLHVTIGGLVMPAPDPF